MKNVLGYFLLLLGIFQACGPSGAEADLILSNGTIYTVDDSQAKVEAVAVKDGRILFAGDAAKLNAYRGANTKEIDLGGKTMIPGFIESHGHFLGLGQAKLNLDLTGLKNYQELLDKVAEAVKTTPKGSWILGRGWHQSKWDELPTPNVKGFQTHDALSAISPDHPVFLTHASGHGSFANAKAMEIAGITSETTVGGDSEIIKDANGNPTGVLVEMASGLVSKHVPEFSEERMRKAMELAIEECLANGITSFQDAGTGGEGIALFQEFLDTGKLDMRLWVMLTGRDHDLLEKWYANGPQIDPNGHLTIRAIKLYADGALGSRGAWLLAPYTDRPGHMGNAVSDMKYIGQVAKEGLEHGFQVCTHAIGDRANREVLDQYQLAFEGNPGNSENHRYRIEHAQHIDPEDIPRFGQMGVIASIQGIHMASDRPWAIDRLGKQRIDEGAYVWQKLLQSGAKVINGTDVPVEPISAINSFYASVSRKTLGKTPEGGYEPSQKMSREEALKSYTLDAAYGAFEENIKGSIKEGKLADFTVLDQDIMTIEEDKILDTKIMMTIVGGEVKYELE